MGAGCYKLCIGGIRKVDWLERDYINQLTTIEGILLSGGPKSYAAALSWNQLEKLYPVAIRAIKAELAQASDAEITSWRSHLVKQEEAAIARHTRMMQAHKRLDQRLEQSERRGWIQAGGRS